MKRWLNLLFLALLVSGIVLTGCNNGDDGNGGAQDKSVVIGLNNWAENVAVSNMWKVLLEEKNYEVELKSMEKAPVWLGITRDELDIAPEVWLPHTDKPLMDKYEENLDMHEIWYENTGLGLVVPSYMEDISSMEELNERKEEFGGRIVGIDPGASLTSMTQDAIEEYGLEFDLVTSSGPAMMAELSKAYKDKEPIVVTLWNPHWAFSGYDLKYLEDPKKVYGDPDDIYYMTRKGFEEDHPEVIKWMNNWQMDDETLGSLMATVKETGDPAEGAKAWIDENRDLVDQWLK
ncbi:glycine betaine ABC transporter substrate-binding protein [Rossellomorea vietnamensis]|uniref:glycine betaine ABC transporter substrate-binding protein n=1 Tax=Rossellomorea vietnamensis TaxID=218284 RepID=UPI003CE888D9